MLDRKLAILRTSRRDLIKVRVLLYRVPASAASEVFCVVCSGERSEKEREREEASAMFVKRRKFANSNNNDILNNSNYEKQLQQQVAKLRCSKHKDCNGGTSEVMTRRWCDIELILHLGRHC